MKNKLIIISCFLVFLSCKSDKKEKAVHKDLQKKETLTQAMTLNGNFIYYDNAAVLQTRSEIYGVIVDSMLHVLDKQSKPYKKEDTDMVPVTVRAKLSNKKDKTEWAKKIEILEVVKISKPEAKDNQVIKIQ